MKKQKRSTVRRSSKRSFQVHPLLFRVSLVVAVVFLGGFIYALSTSGFSLKNLMQGSVLDTSVTNKVMIGANYAHHQVTSCDVTNTGILATYDQPGIRSKVQSQLQTMRTNNIESLRLIVWHMSSAEGQTWGIIPSVDGKLSEPYRTNFKNYLADVKAAGFTRMTISFAPQWTNEPANSNYTPGLLEENWGFIKDVRSLAKASGPADIRFDLHNEGGPSVYNEGYARMTTYLTEVYKRYVATYGKADVTVSIVGPSDSGGTTDRLSNMIAIFNKSGYGQPTWYEFHFYSYGSSATILADLQKYEAILKQNGITQPITIGETYYNNAEVATGVGQFLKSSTRRIDEIIEWPLAKNTGCTDFSENPPYQADAYQYLSSSTPQSKDTVKPTVRITSPKDSQKINNNVSTQITVSASDNIGIAKIVFTKDGNVVCTDTQAPYSCKVTTPKKANTTVLIKATVYDLTGNQALDTVKFKTK